MTNLRRIAIALIVGAVLIQQPFAAIGAEPRISKAMAIAEALGVTLNDLVE